MLNKFMYIKYNVSRCCWWILIQCPHLSFLIKSKGKAKSRETAIHSYYETYISITVPCTLKHVTVPSPKPHTVNVDLTHSPYLFKLRYHLSSIPRSQGRQERIRGPPGEKNSVMPPSKGGPAKNKRLNVTCRGTWAGLKWLICTIDK